MPPKKATKPQTSANVPCASNDELNARVGDIEESLKMGIEELKSQLSSSSNTSEDVSAFTAKLNDFQNKIMQSINSIKTDLLKMKEKVNSAEKLVDDHKQETYLNSVIISGIPEKSNEDLYEEVCKLLNTKILFNSNPRIQITITDINYCQRIGKKDDKRKKFRLVSVEFTNRWMRDLVFNSKKNLKGSGLAISERLTKYNLNLYNKVYAKVGMRRCWTWRGKIFINSDNQKILIVSESDLDSY